MQTFKAVNMCIVRRLVEFVKQYKIDNLTRIFLFRISIVLCLCNFT